MPIYTPPTFRENPVIWLLEKTLGLCMIPVCALFAVLVIALTLAERAWRKF